MLCSSDIVVHNLYALFLGSGAVPLDNHCKWVGGEIEPDQTSFDYDNTSKSTHHNRILLEAEPQIGKTGVYLRVSFTDTCSFTVITEVLRCTADSHCLT